MGRDQFLDDGQAEARALAALVRLLVRLEDAMDVPGGNSRPVVSHRQLEMHPGPGHTHAHGSARRRELDGVADQIQDDLRQSVFVGRDGEIFSRRRRLQKHPVLLGLGAEHVEGTGHDLVQLDGVPLEREHAGPEPVEVQDARDQADQAVHAVVDRLDPVAPLGIERFRRPPQEKLSGGADGGERVTKLVGDLGEELLLVVFHLSQLFRHVIEGEREIADLIVRLDGQRLAEAAIGYPARRRGELAHRSGQAKRDDARRADGHEQTATQGPQHRGPGPLFERPHGALGAVHFSRGGCGQLRQRAV